MTGVRNAVLNWSKTESLAGSSSQPNWAMAGESDRAKMRRKFFIGLVDDQTLGGSGNPEENAFRDRVAGIPDLLLPAVAVGHAALHDKNAPETLTGPVAALGGIDDDFQRGDPEVFVVEFDNAPGAGMLRTSILAMGCALRTVGSGGGHTPPSSRNR